MYSAAYTAQNLKERVHTEDKVMESLYENYLIKVESKILSRKIDSTFSFLIQKYKKMFLITVLIIIPIVVDFFLSSTFLISSLIILIAYPFFYLFHWINEWEVNCKYMP